MKEMLRNWILRVCEYPLAIASWITAEALLRNAMSIVSACIVVILTHYIKKGLEKKD